MSAPAHPDIPRAPTELTAFVTRHGRLPEVGDGPPPWSYSGWALPYLTGLDELCPAVANRWGYYLRTLQAGRLLDEPIPQVRFGPADQRVFTLLREWSCLLGHDRGGWSDFRCLLGWLLWGLARGEEAPRVSQDVGEKLYRQVDLTPLLERPHDYLGDYVAMGRAGGWNPTGFYPTPHPAAECMVRLALRDAGAEGQGLRARGINDPCAGSGRLLLHASNVSLRLSGQDVDPLAVSMCLINGALYAPWMAYPFPDSVLGVEEEGTEDRREVVR